LAAEQALKKSHLDTPSSPERCFSPTPRSLSQAISHSNLVRPKRHRSGRTARQFRPHFISGRDSPPVPSRSSRNDPLAALLAANAMAWFVVAPFALTAGAPLRQEAAGGFRGYLSGVVLPRDPTRQTPEGEGGVSPHRGAWLRLSGERAGRPVRPGRWRNKVETAIHLHHRPSGLVAQAALTALRGVILPVLVWLLQEATLADLSEDLSPRLSPSLGATGPPRAGSARSTSTSSQ